MFDRHSFDTLATRSILVSLFGITLVHALSLWSYQHALDRELALAHEVRLAERIVFIKRTVMRAAPGEREAVAHYNSGGSIEAHWSETPGAAAGGPGIERWHGLTSQIANLAPELTSSDIILGSSSGNDPHIALVSLRLPDESWINVSLFATTRPRTSVHGTLVSTSLMAFGVVLLSVLMARWLTRPIKTVATAASALAPDGPMSRVPEEGPSEIRDLAVAFNDMQARIRDLIARRTQSLAAVSHDLRTPLTRLKLRVEELLDSELRCSMTADIDEMEQMIEATLSYLRGEEKSEPARPIDLAALLATIIDNYRDAGRNVDYQSPRRVVIEGRLIGLKRAFSNLIGNALRFGTHVAVAVEAEGGRVVVTIDDNGPGIPDDQLDAVMEPFVRLEHSRNRETGGVGLGLTIAETTIETHGGTLSLSNRTQGGLRAAVALPRQVS